MKGMTISRWWFIWSRICWVLVYISCKWMNDCVAATAVVFGTFRSYQTEPVHKVAPKTCCASWSLSCLQSKWLPSSIVTLGCALARWLGWVGWVSMLLFFHVHCISFPKQVYMYVFFYSLDLLRKRCMPGTHDFAPTSFCSHGRCLWVEKVSGLCFNCFSACFSACLSTESSVKNWQLRRGTAPLHCYALGFHRRSSTRTAVSQGRLVLLFLLAGRLRYATRKLVSRLTLDTSSTAPHWWFNLTIAAGEEHVADRAIPWMWGQPMLGAWLCLSLWKYRGKHVWISRLRARRRKASQGGESAALLPHNV